MFATKQKTLQESKAIHSYTRTIVGGTAVAANAIVVVEVLQYSITYYCALVHSMEQAF